MDREQVEKWAREASRHLKRWERRFRDEHPDAQMLDIDSASAEWKMEFARLVWNAALDEAKAACDASLTGIARECADAIEKLKEPQP